MIRYEKQQTLGEGTYGIVCKAWDEHEKRIVALKKIKKDHEDDGIPVTSVREIAVLLELKHDNVVDLFDIYVEDRCLFLVFEYCDEDLKHYITHSNKRFNLSDIKSIVYQILQGLAFCHYHQILHRDIKPQNILINKSGTVKLGDFGLARLTTLNERHFTSEVVTLWYRAPEVLLGATTYDGSIDIWSTAAIFGELIKKGELFKGQCKIDQIFKIFQVFGTPTEETWENVTSLQFYSKEFPKWKAKEIHSIFPIDDNKGIDLLKKMFCYSPSKRINAKEALKHPFFDSLNKK
ncbi:Cyclin-dependent kinase 2 [Entamoeba marina]